VLGKVAEELRRAYPSSVPSSQGHFLAAKGSEEKNRRNGLTRRTFVPGEKGQERLLPRFSSLTQGHEEDRILPLGVW
jgi:hypothetical protein